MNFIVSASETQWPVFVKYPTLFIFCSYIRKTEEEMTSTENIKKTFIPV